jgi:hypothetical protein
MSGGQRIVSAGAGGRVAVLDMGDMVEGRMRRIRKACRAGRARRLPAGAPARLIVPTSPREHGVMLTPDQESVP